MAREPYHDENEVRAAVERSRCMTEALRRLGLRPAGGNFGTLRRLIARWDIPTDHFDPHAGRREANHRRGRPLEEIMIRGSTYSRRSLKQRLYTEGLKQRSCELCGQDEIWTGKRMGLILDHINGDPTDNRLENLRIVCPNCAATLETHCARNNRRVEREPRECLLCGNEFVPNRPAQRYCSQACGMRSPRPFAFRPERRKVPRPSHAQLRAGLRNMSFCAVGRKYGVSDNAVRKWLKWYERQQEREAAEPPRPEAQSNEDRDAPDQDRQAA